VGPAAAGCTQRQTACASLPALRAVSTMALIGHCWATKSASRPDSVLA